MFLVGEVVKPSGRRRTATWEAMAGTVTRVEATSVFVQWHNVAVEEELDFEEVVSTGTFQKRVPHHARVLGGSDDGELLTFYDVAAPDEDALFLMSNLYPKETGLPFVVWISLNIGDQHDVRVWVSHSRKASEMVAVAIRPTVRVVGNGHLSAEELAVLRQWIELNRDVLIRHWDGDIGSSADALAALKPLPR